MTYRKAAVRVLLVAALGLSLAGCVVAEPAPSYSYYPSYGYYGPGYYPGYSSFGFSYSTGGWGHRGWRGHDWR